MNLLELMHESDPRYLVAPLRPPERITFDDLVGRRYGKMLIAQVGEVIARYQKMEATSDWRLVNLKRQ